MTAFAAVIAVLFAVHRHSVLSPLRPVVFTQAQDGIASVTYSADGRLLMTTDATDGAVTFRDALTGQIVRQWQGAGARVWLSRDGSRVLVADLCLNGPTQCAVRDAATGRALRRWTGQILDVLPDLSRMVVADDYRMGLPPGPGRSPVTGRVVDVATGHIIGKFPLAGSWGVRLSPDGRFLCLPAYSQPSRLLSLPGMRPLLTLPPLTGMRVSRDGARVIGIALDGTLHVWFLASGRHSVVATGLSRALWVYGLGDGTLVLAGGEGTGQNYRSVVQVRSADGARLLRSFPGDAHGYSPDGRLIAFSGPWDGGGYDRYDVADAETGRWVAHLDSATDALGGPLTRNGIEQDQFAVAPDGRHFALANGGGLLRLYDLTRPAPPTPRAPVSTNGGRAVLSFDDRGGTPIFDAVALPGGGVAASGGSDMGPDQRRVQVWRPGHEVWSVKAVVGNGDVTHLGVSADGGMLAGSSQWGVWMMDLADGGSIATPVTVAPNGTVLYYSSEQEGYPVWLDGPGKLLTVISTGLYGNGAVRLTRWDMAGRRIGEKVVVPGEEAVGGRNYQIADIGTSPDGGTLAVLWNGLEHRMQGGKPVNEMTGDGMMELRDTRTGRLLRTLLASRRGGFSGGTAGTLGRPTFSPDGRLLAVADDTGRVLLWDALTGRRMGQMSGLRASNTGTEVAFVDDLFGSAARLAFSPDSRLLAAARDDGSIYLYSLQTFLPVAQVGQVNPQTVSGYGQMPLPLRWTAFDAGGHTLYGIAQNGTDVLAWDVPRGLL